MRVLFLTHRLPYAANRGDRIRGLQLLTHIAEFADVDLVSLAHSRDEAEHAGDLRGVAASVSLARTEPLRNYARAAAAVFLGGALTHKLLDASAMPGVIRRVVDAHRPDVVLALCSGMARFALAAPLDDIPLVVDMIDVDSEKWRSLSARARGPRRWVYGMEARRLAPFEALASERSKAVLVVNERGDVATAKLEGGTRIVVVKGAGWESGMTGEIRENGRVLAWRDGSIWTRP